MYVCQRSMLMSGTYHANSEKLEWQSARDIWRQTNVNNTSEYLGYTSLVMMLLYTHMHTLHSISMRCRCNVSCNGLDLHTSVNLVAILAHALYEPVEYSAPKLNTHRCLTVAMLFFARILWSPYVSTLMLFSYVFVSVFEMMIECTKISPRMLRRLADFTLANSPVTSAVTLLSFICMSTYSWTLKYIRWCHTWYKTRKMRVCFHLRWYI